MIELDLLPCNMFYILTFSISSFFAAIAAINSAIYWSFLASLAAITEFNSANSAINCFFSASLAAIYRSLSASLAAIYRFLSASIAAS